MNNKELREELCRLKIVYSHYSNIRTQKEIKDFRMGFDELVGYITAHTQKLLERISTEVIGENAKRQIQTEDEAYDWGDRMCKTCEWMAEFDGEKVQCKCTSDNKLRNKQRQKLNNIKSDYEEGK